MYNVYIEMEQQGEEQLLSLSMYNVHICKRGIEPNTGLNPFFKIALNLFLCTKNFFLKTFFFFI